MAATDPDNRPRASSQRAGTFVLAQKGPEPVYAFHPRPLPPDPPLEITPELQALLDRANQSLGRLDGVSALLRDPELLLYSFVRKEAVLSSQIEGTQSSLSDLLLFEQDVPNDASVSDVEETSNYIAAMNHGLARLRDDGFPLSNRLIKEMHSLLLRAGRGSEQAPGEFRRSQNWIGGTRPSTARYVPPPPHEVDSAMGTLERFLHDDPRPTPLLIKAGLAHAQFETIHPFLDGNGRLGRLLITLMLCAEGVLDQPLLYLSLYFKQHRDTYYERLQAVRLHGEWEEWIRFFLDGIANVAIDATQTVRQIVHMVEEDRARVGSLGRAAGTASTIYEQCLRRIFVTAPGLMKVTQLSLPAIYAAIRKLEDQGILGEVTGRDRGRVYAYQRYLALLNEGVNPTHERRP